MRAAPEEVDLLPSDIEKNTKKNQPQYKLKEQDMEEPVTKKAMENKKIEDDANIPPHDMFRADRKQY